jgi:hypothetical protein
MLSMAAACAEPMRFSPKAWRDALAPGSKNWSRVRLLCEFAKEDALKGMDRPQVLELLDEPERSDQIFPASSYRMREDIYKLSSRNDRVFHVHYEKHDRVANSFIENREFDPAKGMGQQKGKTILKLPTVIAFLKEHADKNMGKLNQQDVERELGRSHVTFGLPKGQAREYHAWETYLYYLSLDGNQAFIVTFNLETGRVYDYRLIKVR